MKATASRAKGIGQILAFVDWRVAAQNRRGIGVAKIGMSAAEKPKGLVEAAPPRVELGRAAEMPFADPSCHVTGGLQAVGHRRFRQRQTDAGPVAGIELVAKAGLITARHQAGTRR